MSAAELAMETRPPRPRRSRRLRYFFPGMAVFSVEIAATGFTPEVRRFAAGTFPIPWILHVHAAIMLAWLGAFALQAWLGATGQTALHRRVGPYAVALGCLACASMVFVELRTNIAHPQLRTPSDLDWKLPGPFVFVTFGAFLAWAVYERRRPQWHKRLMTFAVFLSLDAAIQRFIWIPMDFGFWPFAATLNIFLLAPMIGYDLRTLNGRLHPVTVRGTVVLFLSESVLFALWGTAAWHSFALGIGDWMRA
jgi:hypothetical protein